MRSRQNRARKKERERATNSGGKKTSKCRIIKLISLQRGCSLQTERKNGDIHLPYLSHYILNTPSLWSRNCSTKRHSEYHHRDSPLSRTLFIHSLGYCSLSHRYLMFHTTHLLHTVSSGNCVMFFSRSKSLRFSIYRSIRFLLVVCIKVYGK